MDDDRNHVIDLGLYLERRAEAARSRNAFAFHGGDGERSRFALALWRAAFLAGGSRAALLSLAPGQVPGQHVPEALVVLDLGEDPARTAFGAGCLHGLSGVEMQGALVEGPEAVAIYLCEADDKRWYLVIDDYAPPDEHTPEGLPSDILFLAGECAGLLSFRGLAADTGLVDDE